MKESTEAELARLIREATPDQLRAIVARLLEAVIHSPVGEREALKWLRKAVGQ